MKRMVFGTDDILPEISRFFDLLQLHYAPRFGSPRLMVEGKSVPLRLHILASGDVELLGAFQ